MSDGIYSFEDDGFITYKIPKALLANTEFINEHQLDNDCIAILGRLIPLSKKGEIQISRQTLASQTCFRSKGDKAQLFRKISNTLSKLKASGLINIRKDTQLTELYKKQINFISVNPIWDNFHTSKNITNTGIKQEKCTSVKNYTSVNINTNVENNTSAENDTILVQNSACTSAKNYTILVQKTDHYSKNIVSNSKNIVKDQIPQKIFQKFKDKNFDDLRAMTKQTCHKVVKSLTVTHDTCFYVNKNNKGEYIFNKQKWLPYLEGIKSMLESKGYELRHPLELLLNHNDALETKLTLVLNDILTPFAVLALKTKFKIIDGEEESFGGLANAIMLKYQNQTSQQKLGLWECVHDYVLKQVKAELATKHDLIADELFNCLRFDDLNYELVKVYDGHLPNPFAGIELCYKSLMEFEQLFHTPIFTKFLLERAMLAVTISAYHCERWKQINQVFPTFNDYLKDICDIQLKKDLEAVIQDYSEVLNDVIYQ